VAASPAGVIEPALQAAGFSIRDVRWILATHGHFDHIGGAHAAREMTEQPARVTIHEADAHWLANRANHVRDYAGLRFKYLDAPEALAQTDALVMESLSGELAADREVKEGDRFSLGGGVDVSVMHTPGHSPGSVTYVLDGLDWAFCGDAMQVCGSSGNKFPLYVDPRAYRGSLLRLRDDLRPKRLHLGHRYLAPSRVPHENQMGGQELDTAFRESLEFEARLAAAAALVPPGATTAADFAQAAASLGYPADDPLAWPPSFLATLGSYVSPA
jgi:glyoxylase-like metal-dependent hydrolase (beta-lactamase superfamily II)